jgi:hypothetical protein
MVSPLLGSLAATIGKAMSPIFLDAVLTRDVPVSSPDPADPLPPTTTTFPCKAIEDEFDSGTMGGGLVSDTDVKLLILASTLATDPKNLDRITIRGRTYTVVPEGTSGLKAIMTDPARATWELRCSL